MPCCITCGARFQGRGSQCALHNRTYHHRNPRWQDNYNYNYSSDSTDPSSIQYLRATQRRTRPRTLRFASNTYDTTTYDQYNNSNNNNLTTALVPYNHHSGTAETSLAAPLVQTFTTLSHSHAISSLTYSITPQGSQSLTASANFDREQCPVCKKWFPDQSKLEFHQWEFPVGCDVHGVCLRAEDVMWHGTRERHERCFVRGCGSVYRREGGWRGGVVEGHVKGWHC